MFKFIQYDLSLEVLILCVQMIWSLGSIRTTRIFENYFRTLLRLWYISISFNLIYYLLLLHVYMDFCIICMLYMYIALYSCIFTFTLTFIVSPHFAN